jgi:hypothetical protein
LKKLPLNTTDIDQALLNIEKKERSNPLPWNGQFSPQLVEVLLGTYAKKGRSVLDPFAGSGTVLYEAARFGMSGVAADINPAACYMARIYTLANLSVQSREELLDKLDESIMGEATLTLPLFSPDQRSSPKDDQKRRLLKLRHATSDTRARLLLEALLIVADFCDKACDRRTILQTWKRVRAIVRGLPLASRPLHVLNCDARKLPIGNASVDLVITSPPYINVFNYHQNYRSSTEALGWDLLAVAKSEIGSNRKNRANRFLTVIQYCLDMSEVFTELARVCKKDSRVIFVVGRKSNVLSVPFYNGRIIGLLAIQSELFELNMRQERVFTNRFGQAIYEDILHLIPTQKKPGDSSGVGRAVARHSLEQGLKSAPKEVAGALEEAIDSTYRTCASPIYNQSL